MSPQRACNACGRPNCTRHGARPRQTRRYSNTATYRRMVIDVVETYGDTCHYATTDEECPGPIDLEHPPPGEELVLAHYPIAHADGGPFTLDNLRPAHAGCNRRAGR